MSADTVSAIRAGIAALPKQDTPHLRALRKAWSARLKSASPAEVIAVAQGYEQDARQEAKWLGYELIRFHPPAFAALSRDEVTDFAGRAESWYAVDAFGTILLGPLWARGKVSDPMIEALARSDSRWLRRLSLVATVGRNGRPHAPDVGRTLAVCRILAADRDDMVEKALSWALRFLAQRGQAEAVVAFMAELGETLPARVRREVRHKLSTGLKSGRPKASETAN